MNVLLIGDERKNRRMVAWAFSGDAYMVKLASSRAAVVELLSSDAFHVACVDWRMREGDAAEITALLHDAAPELPIIALVGEGDEHFKRGSRTRGVTGHLISPFAIDQLHALLRNQAASEAITGLQEPPAEPEPERSSSAEPLRVLAQDEVSRRCLELALRAARSSAAILILGETGTGKSLLAQTVHANSALRSRPFVTVNCPCLSHELLESDLFGHARGSFTGAVQATWGKVAAADGGTLFLDEIGDLPMSLQPKLLRLLQEKQYERVGETTSRSANVRIIAATNRDLKAEVAAGRFREDLYYRLNVIAIEVPPLRGRPLQIMGAAQSFLEEVARDIGKSAPAFSADAQQMLETYAWPGNLRELRNVVERAAILSLGTVLGSGDFPALVTQAPDLRYQVGGAISLQALENAHIQMVVARSPSLEDAARILGIDKSTLYRKRKQMESRVAPFAVPADRPTNVAVASAI